MKKIIYYILICFIIYIFTLFIIDGDTFYNIVFEKQNMSSNKSSIIMKAFSKSLLSPNNKPLITLLSNDFNDKKEIEIEIEKVLNKEPLIYIYNTHDGETYVNSDTYNIEANVKTASYILQEQLKLYDINSIVEERSPVLEVSKNKEEYKDTYKYSRNYFIETKEKYPSIKYFIDLHRDGVSKKVSTVVIEDKSYAKLMFFLGLGHAESDQNYALVKELESYINKNYPNLLRKTFIRENDSYNQDLSPNSFLIEVGGNYNTIDEVYNSLEVFAKALAYYIGEHDG